MKFRFVIALALACTGVHTASAQSLPHSEAEIFFTRLCATTTDSAKTIIDQKLNAIAKPNEILKFTDTAEAILGSPASPAHNEVLYTYFLQSVVASKKLSENDKLRPSLLLENSQKNQIGTTATNIAYQLPDGSSHSLYDATTPLTLIYFNDPDCDACHKVKENIAASAFLCNLCSENKLSIIGIYPFNDKAKWQSQTFPPFVANGWDYTQSIDEEATYDLPTMPLFYLLDGNKTVIAKNEPSLKKIEKTIADLISANH